MANGQRFQPFFVLLSFFLLVGILLLVSEVMAERKPFHEGVEAAQPHGPAEFPEVFAFDPLEGLGDGSEEIGEPDIHVPPPPMKDPDYWPCSQCHDPKDTVNTERRILSQEHTGITLKHDTENRWCLDCHDAQDRDSLRLASGNKVPFTESYKLCGQCHGTIYRDWRAGIHGKRTGYWNGPKRYLLCVSCHSPHEPHFKALKPLPPPVRPEFLDAGSRPAIKGGGR